MGTNPTVLNATIRQVSTALAITRHMNENGGTFLTAPLETLTDEGVILRTTPEPELIAWLQAALKTQAPPKMRRFWVAALRYLETLKAKQAEAWPRMLRQYDREAIIVRAMILHKEQGIGTPERYAELEAELFAMYATDPQP